MSTIQINERVVMSKLTCGHDPSPHSEHTTGTAHLPDDREVCWDCADAWTRERMRTVDTLGAYLSGDGTAITTWSGGKLANVTYKTTHRVGFGRTSQVFWNATDDTGRNWYGRSQGCGMFTVMHARKGS